MNHDKVMQMLLDAIRAGKATVTDFDDLAEAKVLLADLERKGIAAALGLWDDGGRLVAAQATVDLPWLAAPGPAIAALYQVLEADAVIIQAPNGKAIASGADKLLQAAAVPGLCLNAGEPVTIGQ